MGTYRSALESGAREKRRIAASSGKCGQVRASVLKAKYILFFRGQREVTLCTASSDKTGVKCSGSRLAPMPHPVHVSGAGESLCMSGRWVVSAQPDPFQAPFVHVPGIAGVWAGVVGSSPWLSFLSTFGRQPLNRTPTRHQAASVTDSHSVNL